MRVLTVVDERFDDYKKPSMFIGTISCGGKCCIEAGIPTSVCQNDGWRSRAPVTIDSCELCERYLANKVTEAVIFGGLEPFEQFNEMEEVIHDMPIANEWEFYKAYVHDLYEQIKLPTRATSGSAGYDFRAPFSFTLHPGDTIKIPTGIRVKIEPGWWLACVPRSGLGFKYRMQLNNTIGVIDEDYYGSDNEGHIFAKITNDTNEGKDICIDAGDGFMQAIFIPYGITYNDNAVAVRNGGIGSTGAK